MLLKIQLTRVPLKGQKPVRNQSETRQKPAKRNHLFPPSLPLSLSFSLSLPLPFFPCPATRTPTPIPTPTPTLTPTTTTATTTTTPTLTPTTTTSTSTTSTPTTTSTSTTSTTSTPAAGTTVSFPDRFRTAQAYSAPKFEIECVHAWIVTLITRLATTLSTTTTPAATAPPLPLVHLGISAFAFKNPIDASPAEGSETSQKPVRNRPNATICFPPPSLSLSLFLSFPPFPFLPLPCY